jgi:hypothetical protein
MEAKYHLKFPDLRERISFYAAAYNYGFQSKYDEIRQWEKKVSFPGRTEKSIISYSELAVDFLELMVENIPRYVSTKEVIEIQNEKDAIVAVTDTSIKGVKAKNKKENERKHQSVDSTKNGFDYRWLFLLALLPIVFLRRKKKK